MTPSRDCTPIPAPRIAPSRRLGGASPRDMEIASAVGIVFPKPVILARIEASITLCAPKPALPPSPPAAPPQFQSP
jgi:hypothetical protein